MKHAKLILFLGSLVTIMPFLGFPNSWKQGIFAALGMSIIAVTFRMMATLHREYDQEHRAEIGNEHEGATFENHSVSTHETLAAHEH